MKNVKTPDVYIHDEENVSEQDDEVKYQALKDVKNIELTTFEKRYSNQDELRNFASDLSDTSPMRLVNIVRQSSQDRDPISWRLDDSTKITFNNTSRISSHSKLKMSFSKKLGMHKFTSHKAMHKPIGSWGNEF